MLFMFYGPFISPDYLNISLSQMVARLCLCFSLSASPEPNLYSPETDNPRINWTEIIKKIKIKNKIIDLDRVYFITR
jgi:hypothetical protein